MFGLTVFGASCLFVDGSIDLRRRLNINWAGVKSSHDFKGELRYCKSGRYGSRLSYFAFCKMRFATFTYTSARPFELA